MYRSAPLDSFLRLLVVHLTSVLEKGEQALKWQTEDLRMQMLQLAIDHGENSEIYQTHLDRRRSTEELFVLQTRQACEWVGRLGLLAPDVERQTDEFLVATCAIGNQHDSSDEDRASKSEFLIDIEIEAIICAIYELLGRLEDRYSLAGDLMDEKQVVNGSSFGQRHSSGEEPNIIQLFPGKNKVS